MPRKVKRTYNLAAETVRRVRELSEDYAVAPSQDAVIELAVDELDRRLREHREAEMWAAASSDPEFQAEAADIGAAYGTADLETWPR
jgi:predicted kinase